MAKNSNANVHEYHEQCPECGAEMELISCEGDEYGDGWNGPIEFYVYSATYRCVNCGDEIVV